VIYKMLETKTKRKRRGRKKETRQTKNERYRESRVRTLFGMAKVRATRHKTYLSINRSGKIVNNNGALHKSKITTGVD